MHSATFATMATKLVSLGAAAAMVALGMATAAPPVRPVPHVDMQRYAGMWYEVARLPNGLQANCVADVTATYRLLDDGSLKVINRCREGERRFSIAVGRAVPASGDPSWARLKLSYQPRWLQWLPASSIDYWVVMLDPDYRYAVVSEPSRGSLWILSRTPTMDSAMYDGIVARLRAQRYPVDELVPTPQLQPLRHPPVVAARPRLMV
jgi:apolipoprotein D and lipocalin family protein